MIDLIMVGVLCETCSRWDTEHIMEPPYVIYMPACCSVFTDWMFEKECYYYNKGESNGRMALRYMVDEEDNEDD